MIEKIVVTINITAIMKAPRSLRVYEYYATREPTSSSFATAWPSLPRPTMWDYQNEFEFHQSPDEPFLLQAVRKWIPEVRRHRPGAPVVLVATQASPCHKHHKSSTLVVVTVISRKSTVTKILHPDRPSWLPSITFPPRKEPWHTQVGAKLIAQVFWCWQSQHLCHLEIIENLTLHINPHLPILLINYSGHCEGNLMPTPTLSAPPSQGSVWRMSLTRLFWQHCFQGNQFIFFSNLSLWLEYLFAQASRGWETFAAWAGNVLLRASENIIDVSWRCILWRKNWWCLQKL